MQHYLHVEFLANHLPALPTSLHFTHFLNPPLYCEFPFHKTLFILSFKNISSKLAHFLFPSGFTDHNPCVTEAVSSPGLLLATTTPASSSSLQSTTWFFWNTITSRTSLKNTRVECVWFSMLTKPRKLHWAKGCSWPDRSSSHSFFTIKRTNPTSLPLPHTCNLTNKFCS